MHPLTRTNSLLRKCNLHLPSHPMDGWTHSTYPLVLRYSKNSGRKWAREAAIQVALCRSFAVILLLHCNLAARTGDATAYDFLARNLPAAAARAGVPDDGPFRALFAMWCDRQGFVVGGHPRTTSPLQAPLPPHTAVQLRNGRGPRGPDTSVHGRPVRALARY